MLYDIGQTEYQLLDYASALKTMERYLAETGPTRPTAHEVEATVEVLRGRVGPHPLTTDGGACDVAVDDQPAGTTPLDGPLLVSVGPRKIALACASDRAAIKRIEVSAGETARLDLKVPRRRPIAAVRAAMHGAAPRTKPRRRSRARLHHRLDRHRRARRRHRRHGHGHARRAVEPRLDAQQFRPTAPTSIATRRSPPGLAISCDVLGAASSPPSVSSTYLTIKYERSKRRQRRVTARGLSVGGTF